MPDQRGEIASEYRYRDSVPDPKTLVVTISQSRRERRHAGALKHARSLGMEHVDHLQCGHQRHGARVPAGPSPAPAWEIGVASTKAFTTQLVGCSC